MGKLLIVAVLCLFSTILISASPVSKSQRVSSFKSEKAASYRLPKNTVPLNYTVHLTTRVDQKDFGFTGEVEIGLVILEKTKNITIHKRQLTIGEVELQCDDAIIADPKFTFDEVTEHLVFDLKDEYDTDTECLLKINYNGTLRTDNGGFYRSSYTDEEGEIK